MENINFKKGLTPKLIFAENYLKMLNYTFEIKTLLTYTSSTEQDVFLR